MGFIQCSGCKEILDIRGIESVVCPACNRCLICAAVGKSSGVPSCGHRLDDETVGELEASLGCPDDSVDHRLRVAAIQKRGYTPAGCFVLAVVVGTIGGALVAFARIGVERLFGRTVGAVAFAVVFVAVIIAFSRGVPHVLARGWFPWMVRGR